jgi:hypothetical protein
MNADGRFETLAEIREYLAGDRVECLVCGKRFLRLSHWHLMKHAMSANDYRERFGIPWTYSLTSSTSRNNSRIKTKQVNLDNLFHRRCPGDQLEPSRLAPLAARNYWRDNIRPQGPLKSAQLRIVVPCDDCGVDVATTRLTHVHGTRCVKCRVIAKAERDRVKALLLLPRAA